MPTQLRISTVREQCRTLSRQISRSSIDLAPLVREVYSREYWIEWGFPSFVAYLEEELEIKYRKAMYLIDVGDLIARGLVTIRRARTIGYAKITLISKIITDDNKEEMLSMAESVSLRELGGRVIALRTSGLKAVGSLTYVIRRTEKQELVNRIYTALEKILEFRQLPLTVKEDLAVETADCVKEKMRDHQAPEQEAV